MPTTRTSILCIDDTPYVGEALARWFRRLSDFTWLGWVGTMAEGAQAVERLRPDILLMDYDMPGEDPCAMVAHLRVSYPGMKVIVLSGHCYRIYIERALRCGAAGYLVKSDTPAEIAAAVQQVRAGKVALSPEARAEMETGMPPPVPAQPKHGPG